jgi:hypothetical protein
MFELAALCQPAASGGLVECDPAAMDCCRWHQPCIKGINGLHGCCCDMACQVQRSKEEAAGKLHSLHLQKGVLRAWLQVSCRAAGARRMNRRLAAKQASAVLTAFAGNAQRQQYKRLLQQQADNFRKIRLLLLCVRWWKAWARYRRVLNQAEQELGFSARSRVLRSVVHSWSQQSQYRRRLQVAGEELQARVRSRVLRCVFDPWQGLARFKAWEKRASAAAEGFYWSKLVTAVFFCWRRYTIRQRQAAVAAAAAEDRRHRQLLQQVLQAWQYQAQLELKLTAAVKGRERRLLCAALQEWWLATFGSKMVLQFRVSTLVRLVGTCFRLWRVSAVAELHHQRRLKCAALGAWWQLTCERHIEAMQLKMQHDLRAGVAGLQGQLPASIMAAAPGDGAAWKAAAGAAAAAAAASGGVEDQQHCKAGREGDNSPPGGSHDGNEEDEHKNLSTTALQAWQQGSALLHRWHIEAPLLAAAYYQTKLMRNAWRQWRQLLLLQASEPAPPPAVAVYDTQLPLELLQQQQQQQQRRGPKNQGLPSGRLQQPPALAVRENQLQLTAAAAAPQMCSDGNKQHQQHQQYGPGQQLWSALAGEINLPQVQLPEGGCSLLSVSQLDLQLQQLEDCSPAIADTPAGEAVGRQGDYPAAAAAALLPGGEPQPEWQQQQQQQQQQQCDGHLDELEELQYRVAGRHHAASICRCACIGWFMCVCACV